MTCFTSYCLYDPLKDPWKVMCLYFCSSGSSSSKLQETSFVCRLYNMNAYKIQQAEFSYRMYTHDERSKWGRPIRTNPVDPVDYYPWRWQVTGERLWCVGFEDKWYNRVVHATGTEITGTEKLYVVPLGAMCYHGSECALVGFVRGSIVCI